MGTPRKPIEEWIRTAVRLQAHVKDRRYTDLPNGLRLVIRPGAGDAFTLEAWRSGEAPFKRDANGDVQLGSARMRLLQREAGVIEREAEGAGLRLSRRTGIIPEPGTSPEKGLDYAVTWTFKVEERFKEEAQTALF